MGLGAGPVLQKIAERRGAPNDYGAVLRSPAWLTAMFKKSGCAVPTKWALR